MIIRREWMYQPIVNKVIDWKLLAIRLSGTLVLLGVFMHAAFAIERYKFFVAYTQWGLILTMLMFFLLTILTIFPNCFIEFVNFGEVFYETMWSSEFVITLIFWMILFPYSIITGPTTKPNPNLSDLHLTLTSVTYT